MIKINYKVGDHDVRPWGYYEVIQVDSISVKKCLVINPDSSISLQYHNFRSERWKIICGVATITLNDDTNDFYPNENITIPAGVKHRIRNNKAFPLVIIEEQIGSKLDENDIVRISDDYDRI